MIRKSRLIGPLLALVVGLVVSAGAATHPLGDPGLIEVLAVNPTDVGETHVSRAPASPDWDVLDGIGVVATPQYRNMTIPATVTCMARLGGPYEVGWRN
jgi:hypothetical protein